MRKFEKVSYEQYKMDFADTFGIDDEEAISAIYNDIKLPKRATKGSAGYDFFAPTAFILEPGKTIKIPTGIRVLMNEGEVFILCPRSSLGFKYRMQLNNTLGIIDFDYAESDNEGHIFAKITNDTNEDKVLSVEAGGAFMQGIFMNYLTTDDDETDGIRNGGMGSTGV